MDLVGLIGTKLWTSLRLSYRLGLRLSYGLGQMATIEDIRQRLLAGEQPVDLVKAGFPKSSVYRGKASRCCSIAC